MTFQIPCFGFTGKAVVQSSYGARLADMASRRHVRYSPLAVDEYDDHDGTHGRKNDPRFDYNPRSFDRIPWKSIALALFLLSLASLLLFLSVFVLTGHMAGEDSQG